jgi:RNA polymerase sigma factor (sigma-70 family)
MKKGFKKKYPWLNSDGTLLSDEKLKEIVKTWTPDIWERYLKSLEVNSQEATPPNLKHFDLRSEHTQISEYFNADKNEDLKRYKNQIIHSAIESLTEKQRTVIELRYWNNLTYKQIGKKLSISHPAVIKLEKKAITNMEKHILKNFPSHNCK